MKLISKFIIFLIILLLTITAFSINTIPVNEVKLLVGGGPSVDDCLMNINKDGTVEYISFEMGAFNFHTEEIKGLIHKRRTIRLSNKNKVIVNELTQRIITSESAERIDGNGFIEIQALIDNERYYSTYGTLGASMNLFYDENLAELCYKLVEIAPFKVGGDDNPLEVPPDEYR